jgi:succinoglycan biosynthesis protein ExoM
VKPVNCEANMLPHITVCVCTYKRPESLGRLLCGLEAQETARSFTYSIVIVDNDVRRSAESTVMRWGAGSSIPFRYDVEVRESIALARNMAVKEAKGNFIAFIDDDEFPTAEWLLRLFAAVQRWGSHGALGPVLPYFDVRAPLWVKEGGFYERPRYTTGMPLLWSQCRTGNVLFKSAIVGSKEEPFDSECVSGEDLDFFKRMTDQGRVFVWCDEAVVYEEVPPSRWKRGFLLRRAMVKGIFSLRHRRSVIPIATSLIGAPAFGIAAPLALVAGQSSFMKCLFKSCYHAGRVLALVGINPIGNTYSPNQ